MSVKKICKLSVFFTLVILIATTKGQDNIETLPTVSEPGNLKENAVVIENSDYDYASEIETTTSADEGSGTTIVEDDTTESATQSGKNGEDITTTTEAIIETTTNKIDCTCDCIVNDNKITLGCSTQSPLETQTDSTENPETTITSNNEEATTKPTNEELTTTETNSEADITTQPAEAIETTTTTVPPPPICSTPGIQANNLNCQQYDDCSLEGSQDGSFHLLTKSCPEKQAFNIELNRCSRDISSCSLPIQCLVKGGVADPVSNTSYYLCEPRLIGVGFRVFHVDCSANEIFYPELGKCYVDFNNLPTQGFPPLIWNQIRDIDIVKAELKLLKDQDKLKLKQEKDRKKAEEKLQKEIEKEAKKKAKEEEKANKEKAKQQAATFVCLQEGNFASEIGENVYYSCINKKGKLKAIPMQCSFGATFNPETGTCINGSTNVDISISVEDDD